MSETVKDQTYLHQREAAVYVPAQQAGLVAVGVFVSTFVLAVVFSVSPLNALKSSAAVGVVAGVLFLGLRLWHWYGLTAIQMIEPLVGRDLDGDGVLGQSQSPRVVRVEHRIYDSTGKYRGTDFSDEDADLIFRVADALYNKEIPFSVGKMVNEFHVITRAEYDRLSGEWIKDDDTGYLEWKNAKFKNLGCRPTTFGEQTFKAVLDANHSPTHDG